jgi:hypothetical protein
LTEVVDPKVVSTVDGEDESPKCERCEGATVVVEGFDEALALEVGEVTFLRRLSVEVDEWVAVPVASFASSSNSSADPVVSVVVFMVSP